MPVERWSTAQVEALAPDAASVKAGRGLSGAASWSAAGRVGDVLWGLCRNYQVCVDLSGPAFKCSCPSRKIPCKHCLGLLLRWSESDVSAFAPATDTAPGPGAGGTPGAAVAPAADAGSALAPGGVAADAAGVPVPAFVLEWQAARAAKAQSKQQAAESGPADPAAAEAAAAKRAEQRAARVAGGMTELGRWLDDQLQQGLAAAKQAGPQPFETMAARLVDAQAPAAAGAVRRLASVAGIGPQWADRLLGELALLRLLVAAHENLPDLPAPLAATVRTQIGFPISTDEVLAGPRVTARWQVLGQVDTDDGTLTTRRTWLRSTDAPDGTTVDGTTVDGSLCSGTTNGGTTGQGLAVGEPVGTGRHVVGPTTGVRRGRETEGLEPGAPVPGGGMSAGERQGAGRFALVLSFAAPGQSLAADLVPGTEFRGDLVFYPGAAPLRAVVAERHSAAEPFPTPGGAVSLSQALAEASATLAADPWRRDVPVLLDGVIPTADGWLTDAEGASLPLAPGHREPWWLLAAAGGTPATVAAEWSPAGLRPLSAWVGGHYHPSAPPLPDPQAPRSPELPPHLLTAALVGTTRRPWAPAATTRPVPDLGVTPTAPRESAGAMAGSRGESTAVAGPQEPATTSGTEEATTSPGTAVTTTAQATTHVHSTTGATSPIAPLQPSGTATAPGEATAVVAAARPKAGVPGALGGATESTGPDGAAAAPTSAATAGGPSTPAEVSLATSDEPNTPLGVSAPTSDEPSTPAEASTPAAGVPDAPAGSAGSGGTTAAAETAVALGAGTRVAASRRGSGASALLEAAAVALTARRVGAVPGAGRPVVSPAPVETTDALPVPAGRRLARILGDGVPGGAQLAQELLAQWLAAAAEHGGLVPPGTLPALLDAGRRNSLIRPDLARVAGHRGRWLAAMRTDWRWLADEVADWPTPPAPVSPALVPPGLTPPGFESPAGSLAVSPAEDLPQTGTGLPTGPAATAGTSPAETLPAGILPAGTSPAETLPAGRSAGASPAGREPDVAGSGVGTSRSDDVWETSPLGERLGYLTSLRRSDPVRARVLLETTWARESSEDRARFVRVLENGLSTRDDAFLERALDDRRKEVREAALDLLRGLPGSSLRTRMGERARKAVQQGQQLIVTPPDELTAELRRDGVGASPARGTGVGAWLLEEIVAGAPLDVWDDPATMLRRARATDWEGPLAHGWAKAAITQEDQGWATVLLREVSGTLLESVRWDLQLVLPAEELARMAAEALRNDDAVSNRLLSVYPGRWPDELSVVVIETIAHRARTDRHSWQLGELCRAAGLAMPPDYADLVGRLAVQLDQEPADQSRVRPVADLARALAFRREMFEEFFVGGSR